MNIVAVGAVSALGGLAVGVLLTWWRLSGVVAAAQESAESWRSVAESGWAALARRERP